MNLHLPSVRNLRTQFSQMLHPDDEMAQSRVHLLSYCCLANVVANLIGGNFQTGLLLYLDASAVQIGLINIVSYICNLLQLFAPLILERFVHRKKLLVTLFILIRGLNIIGISLASLLPVSGQIRVYIIVSLIAFMNIINSVWSPGASVWHIQCVPEQVRARYFSVQQRLVNVIVYVFLLSASALTDYLKAADHELFGYLLLRGVAAGFWVLETLCLLHVKEYEYPKGEPIHLKSILTEPFKQKRYMLSISIPLLWNFLANTTSSFFSVYLLDYVHMSYTYMNIVSAMYVPIVLVFMPIWNRQCRKHSWFNLTWKAMLPYGILCVTQMFTAPGAMWVYAVTTGVLHIFGVGINLVWANLTYYNLPKENQTIYLSFYAVGANLAALLGTTYATKFADVFDGHVFQLLGMELQTAQFMQMVTGLLLVVFSGYLFFLDRYEKRKYGVCVGTE